MLVHSHCRRYRTFIRRYLTTKRMKGYIGARMARGELGLAKSFIAANWSASDLVTLMQMALKVKAKLEKMVQFYARVDFSQSLAFAA